MCVIFLCLLNTCQAPAKEQLSPMELPSLFSEARLQYLLLDTQQEKTTVLKNQAMQMMSGKIKTAKKNVSYVEYRNCKPSQACSKVEHRGGTVKIMTIATKFKALKPPHENPTESLPTRAHLKKSKTHLSDRARAPKFLDGHSGDLCKEIQSRR